MHPALPDHPGHALWKRDYSGSSGLFSIVLKPASDAAVAAFLDGLELFGLGYSWGGYESLALPFDCTASRTATRFAPGGPTVRFSVGLEDIEDLKADLDRGFAPAEGDGVSGESSGRPMNQDCACLCGAVALHCRGESDRPLFLPLHDLPEGLREAFRRRHVFLGAVGCAADQSTHRISPPPRAARNEARSMREMRQSRR